MQKPPKDYWEVVCLINASQIGTGHVPEQLIIRELRILIERHQPLKIYKRIHLGTEFVVSLHMGNFIVQISDDTEDKVSSAVAALLQFEIPSIVISRWQGLAQRQAKHQSKVEAEFCSIR